MRLAGRKLSITAQIGLAVIAANLLGALFAPWLAPYGESELVGATWEAPGGEFLLGTDSLGRDMLSRMLYGARTTIGIALACTLLAFFIGMATGFTAAILGGWLDQVLSRIVDALMAIPTLILALLVLSALGTSIPVLIGVIAVLESTRVFRISRAVGMDISVMEYVEVAKLRGEGLGWIVRREVLPNALAPLVTEFGLRFCFAFLLIAALSFLGLGVQPPMADWGSMVRDNAQAMEFGILAPLFPAMAIGLLTISVNLVVDWFLSTQGESLEARQG